MDDVTNGLHRLGHDANALLSDYVSWQMKQVRVSFNLQENHKCIKGLYTSKKKKKKSKVTTGNSLTEVTEAHSTD